MEKNKVTPIKRRTVRHRHSLIIYLDEERMKLYFWNLVIRVDSINRLFGQVNLFVRKHRLHAQTNGKLVILTEMISPPAYLTKVVSDILTPLGMEYGEDYLLVMEEPLRGVGDRYSPYIEEELPATRQYDWISSFLDFNGCFVWLIDSG
jgi:hypothetical protein